MKLSLLTAAVGFILSQPAMGSWMRVNCTNAAVTTQTFSGHDRNEVVLTEIKRSADGNKVIEKKLSFSRGEFLQSMLNQSQLRSERFSSCETQPPENNFGWYSVTEITYQQVYLTKADGTLFSPQTVGVSENLKSVQADLICERRVNGEMPCPKP